MTPVQRHELRRRRLELIKAVPIERELARQRDEQRRAVVELSAVAAIVPDAETLAELAAKNAELKRTCVDWERAHGEVTRLQTSVHAAERACLDPSSAVGAPSGSARETAR